ncbi:MAG: TIGR03435 family protein [Bryobacteraceae bacterium]
MKQNRVGKKAALVLAALFALAPVVFGQTPASPPADAKPAAATAVAAKPPAGGWAFEVATIKPAQMPTPADVMNGKMHVGMKTDAARVDIGFMSLTDLIGIAYDVKPYQISGPDWMGGMGERFDILAKMPEGATKEQVPAMLQALLADRFKLAIHRESKERPVYELVVGKGGPKMKESPPDAPAPPAAAAKSDAAPGAAGADAVPAKDAEPQIKFHRDSDGSGTATVHTPEGNTKMSYGPNGMHLEMEKITMAKLAEALSRFVDRPVVDKTELKGNYQVALDLTMADLMSAARSAGMAMPGAAPVSGDAGKLPSDAASDPSGSIFKSVAQLGLKLEPRKAPVDRIVVDHIEKTPTEN